jgi:hypothetical protein
VRGDVDPKLSHLRSIVEEPANKQQTVSADEIARVTKSRQNLEVVAEQTFSQLDSMRPMPMPERVVFSRTDILAKWHNGSSAIPDELKGEFSTWLEAVTRRSNAIEENKRKLRTTMWSEVVMRACKRHDYADQFADFHRTYWRIALVSDDSAEREKQIESAVKYL